MELDQKVKDAVKTISDWVEENKDESNHHERSKNL